MFTYPKQAEFNRTVPKTKIYAHANCSKRLKELFVSQVGEIIWKFKLAPETINLPARNGIHEIQVFEITLKTLDISESVLCAIDKAVPSPIFYQLVFGGNVKFAAAWKRPNEAAPSKNVIAAFFQSDWQPSTSLRPPLPVVLDMAALYAELLRSLMPLPKRKGENIAEHIERVLQLRTKQKERLDLEARLPKEKQFNRKVEINARLRATKIELEKLSNSLPNSNS